MAENGYEYEFITGKEMKNLQTEVNKRGRTGGRLVHIIVNGNIVTAVMEREIGLTKG